MKQFEFSLGVLSGILMILVGCSHGKVAIPFELRTSKTKNLIRLKGTHVFVEIPPSYQYISSEIRVQKRPDTYFEVTESMNTSFEQVRSELTKDKLQKEFENSPISFAEGKYNGYPYIFFSGPGPMINLSKAMLSFGDYSFLTSYSFVYPTEDTTAENELNKILLSTYYDRSAEVDSTELLSYHVDTSITGFSLVMAEGNIFTYMVKSNRQSKQAIPSSSYFTISVSPSPDFGSATEHLKGLVESVTNANKILLLTEKNIVIGNNRAHEIKIEYDYGQGRSAIYALTLQNDGKAFYFFGNSGESQSSLIEKYKETAATIVF